MSYEIYGTRDLGLLILVRIYLDSEIVTRNSRSSYLDICNVASLVDNCRLSSTILGVAPVKFLHGLLNLLVDYYCSAWVQLPAANHKTLERSS